MLGVVVATTAGRHCDTRARERGRAPCQSGSIRSIALSGNQLALVCLRLPLPVVLTNPNLPSDSVPTTRVASQMGLRQYVFLPVEVRLYLFVISLSPDRAAASRTRSSCVFSVIVVPEKIPRADHEVRRINKRLPGQ